MRQNRLSRLQGYSAEPVYATDLITNELRIHKIDLNKDITDLRQQVFLNLIINAEQAN